MSNENAQLDQMKSILQKSLVTIKKLEAEMATLKSSESEPIAIVGMGLRMPGNVNTIEDLWQILINKEDTITEIPKDRWDADAIYSEDVLAPGKSNSKHGSFLQNDVKTFDAGFFGIPPREAKSIDPLQRMLLEVTQETLEKSGIAPDQIRGTKTGVFLGIGNSDYSQARLRSGNLEDVDVYDATGIPFATASGRLSYLFDLQGPSFTIDSACSSAIVGLHLASESLRKKESNMAIVGAANLILTPELYVGLSKLGSMSTDGKCKAFDENADGYVRGEGCGIVLLKRLKDAEADNDNILAVIKGSAVQHDGLSNGFTAPNPEVQISVINDAIKNAGINASSVDFVEAHGVGNKFTDALEIQSIQKSYGQRDGKVYVGSVKPNIGHLEAAIGMAMLAKLIGAFQHEKIPANIHLNTPNKDVDWDNINTVVPTDAIEWKKENPLRAAINLSGYSGTNAHMIFESYKTTNSETIESDGIPYPVILSAKTKEALDHLVDTYLDQKESLSQIPLKDISWTLVKGRSAYDYKLSAFVDSHEALTEALTAYKENGKHKSILQSDPENVRSRDIAMLFTGQGAQYHGMCQNLYKNETVFTAAVDQCNELLKPHLEKEIVDVLYGEDTESINQTIYTQPGLFVVEYALAQLWKSYGIEPAAVVGHSVGEFVALTIAGVLSLEDALLLIANRGKLMQSLPTGEGGMAAILAEESIVKEYLKDAKQVNIAAVNSPTALTISGNKDEIDAIVAKVKEDGLKAVSLVVSHAFHSYLMEPILEEFESIASKVTLNTPQIPVISNVTGKELTKADLTPQYFTKHIRGTVRYWDNVQYLDEELGIDVFLEAGPNPTLVGLAKKGLTKPTALFLSSAKRRMDDRKMIWTSLQKLYLSDININWDYVFSTSNANKVVLPTYPWQRQEYWYNPVKGMPTSTTEVGGPIEQPIVDNTQEAAGLIVTKDNLMEIMQRESARILGLPRGTELDIYKSIREQGFDSMMSGEFLATMEKYLNTKIDMSLIHIYGDLNALYNYWIKEYIGDEEGIQITDVMFNADIQDSMEVEEDEEDWHKIKESDGAFMKAFKKFDKLLGVSGEE